MKNLEEADKISLSFLKCQKESLINSLQKQAHL